MVNIGYMLLVFYAENKRLLAQMSDAARVTIYKNAGKEKVRWKCQRSELPSMVNLPEVFRRKPQSKKFRINRGL
jgi:hypothetical protein